MMTFRKYLGFELVGLMIGGTSSALAADGEAAGLPQLDITTWPNQLFWLVVTFGIGYIIMSRMITPRIGNVLEQRGRTIQDDLNRAKEAEAEAQAMKAEFEASLDDARTRAADAAQKAMSEAKVKAEESEAEQSAKLASKTKAAEAKLAKIRDEALANINEVAIEITQDVVKAVTGMTVTKAEATKSVAILAKADAGQEA